MAGQQEQRANTVSIPRSTANTILGAVLSLVVAAGIGYVALRDVVTTLEARVSHLEDFGPRTGGRFTKQDGNDMKADIRDIRRELYHHNRLDAHSSAEARLQAHERAISDIRQHMNNVRNNHAPR